MSIAGQCDQIPQIPHSPTLQADPLAELYVQFQQAIRRAQLPGALEALLLALFASLLGRPGSMARAQWHPHPTDDHPTEPTEPRRESKSARRLRAWIGWILRCLPGLGMAPSDAAPARPCPTRTARAPPRRA